MNAFDSFLNIYNYIRPVLDIGILAFILYEVYIMIAKTQGVQIIRTLAIFVAAFAIAMLLDLRTLRWLMGILAPVLIVCFVVIFQPELRKIFLKIGQGNWRRISSSTERNYVEAVLTAADNLSKLKRGMLVVFLRQTGIKDIMESGTKINADVSSALLFTIFSHDTPLHDGATVIKGGKILYSGCFLPLSEQYDIKKTFGTRHRAALGLAEETDAVVLIVSEESGAISLAYDSRLYYDLSLEQVMQTLEGLFQISSEKDGGEESE